MLISLITRYYRVHSIPARGVYAIARAYMYTYTCVRVCVYARFEDKVIELGHLPTHLGPRRSAPFDAAIDPISRLFSLSLSYAYLEKYNNHAPAPTLSRTLECTRGKRSGDARSRPGVSVAEYEKRSKTARKVGEQSARPGPSYLSAPPFLRRYLCN